MENSGIGASSELQDGGGRDRPGPLQTTTKVPISKMTAIQIRKPALESIQFHGDELLGVRHPETGEPYVVIKRMAECLELDFTGQQAKLAKTAWATTEKISVVGSDGKDREMSCLPVKQVPMWLVTLSPGHVKDPAKRERLITYQKEAALALEAHFLGTGPLATSQPAPVLQQKADWIPVSSKHLGQPPAFVIGKHSPKRNFCLEQIRHWAR